MAVLLINHWLRSVFQRLLRRKFNLPAVLFDDLAAVILVVTTLLHDLGAELIQSHRLPQSADCDPHSCPPFSGYYG